MKLSLKRLFALFAVLMMTAVMSVPGAGAEGTEAVFDAEEMFSGRDLEQEADLSKAVRLEVKDGENISVTDAGVYVLSGSAKNVTVTVEAGKDDKVQIVLEGVTVENDSLPVIYVKKADKVFITVSEDSALSVTGKFDTENGKADGVVFSKSDLTLNGTAALRVSSTADGIVCKDDLRITGGGITVNAQSTAVRANDSIRIAGGTLVLTGGDDGLHAENDDDDTLGNIYIGGGSISIKAGDDGIHAGSVLQTDGGSVTVEAAEGIEGTYIQFNGGTIDIRATDDGVNAGRKSKSYPVTVVFNGGEITIVMGAGDTDGVDANGDIIMNGGTVSVTGNNAFDWDGTAIYNGGVVIVNGQQVDGIPGRAAGNPGGGRR